MPQEASTPPTASSALEFSTPCKKNLFLGSKLRGESLPLPMPLVGWGRRMCTKPVLLESQGKGEHLPVPARLPLPGITPGEHEESWSPGPGKVKTATDPWLVVRR